MSMDTIMEDSDYSVSNTDAIIYCASDISGWTESLISDPNIPNSSSTSEDECQQQQISTAAAVAVGGGGNDDLMITVSLDESSGSTNNNKQIEQKIRIFNVDLTRPHECSICGLEFPTGQALGGHMTRHRAIITNEDEYQQQISTGGDDLMIIVSSGESSRTTNHNKQIGQKIRIFNVDFMGSAARPHECSICGLEFPTSQALGGHMRRHREIITSEEDEYQQQISTGCDGGSGDDLMIIVSSGESSRSTNHNKKFGQKLHECSICGLEFSSGQALGGHMRRHRAIIMTENLQVLPQLVKRSRILCLDLNLTPLENYMEFF